MPVTLVTTIGGATANSYVTEAEANTYFAARLYVTAWDDADDKTAALAQAARMLDSYIDWKGTRASTTQALAWPRQNVQRRDMPTGTYFESTVLPQFLKDAQCELALSLIVQDRLEEQNDGVASVSVAGGVAVTFNRSDRADFLPDSVRALTDYYGRARSRRSSTVALVRV